MTLIYAVIFAFLLTLQDVSSDGIISLELISYHNPGSTDYLGMCCDGGGWCISPCDNYFTICGRLHGHPKCEPVSRTGVFRNDNLAFPKDLKKGLWNPVNFEFKGPYMGNISLNIEVWDEDIADVDDLVDMFAKNMSLKAGLRVSDATVKRIDMEGTHSRLKFDVRIYCSKYFYGKNCEIYCKPSNNASGHYNCNKATGAKVCLKGYKGDNCTETVCRNGCSIEHGTCRSKNECICSTGWEGYNCTQCIRKEGCQNGYCREAFQCICRRGWTGEHCNQDLESCRSSPCQNGGKCRNIGPDLYNCTCPFGFEGKNCQIEQDPCLFHHEYYAEGRTPDDNIDPSGPYRHDRKLKTGWYRIKDAKHGQLSTQCYPMYHCGTKYPMHMQTEASKRINDVVDARVCVSSCGGCCYMSMDIKVKYCSVNGTYFYVYKLKPPLSNEMGYCVV